MQPDAASLLDILDSARLIQHYVSGKSRAQFLDDTGLQDMVVRRFEVIGEAAHRVSQETRSAPEGILWPRWIGLRNVLIHQYEKIDFDLLWDVIQSDLPELIQTIAPLVPRDDEQ